MKLTISQTEDFVLVNGMLTRIWKGTTERGTPVIVAVAAIAVPEDAVNHEDEAELLELIELMVES